MPDIPQDVVWPDAAPVDQPKGGMPSDIVWPDAAPTQTAQPTVTAPSTGPWVGSNRIVITPRDKLPPQVPMPGVLESAIQGAVAGTKQVGQSAGVVSGAETAPQPIPEQTPAAEPFEWRDVAEPTRALSKITYQAAKGYPTIGLGIAGGLAGAATPIPGASLAGGAAGAGIGAAIQAIGPSFAEQLRRTPDDPNGAWDRAVEMTTVSGAGAGASWALFPLKIPGVASAVKNTLLQIFGVQPAVGAAEQAARNVIQGEPVTTGLAESYPQSVAGTAIPMIGHFALTRPSVAPPTPGPISKGAMLDWYNKTFQPELVSDKALQADPQFARYKSASAQERDAIIRRSEENYYRWRGVPDADRYAFMQDFESGTPLRNSLVAQYPWMVDRANDFRNLLRQAYQDEQMYGSKAGYLEDYFPHIWENPTVAKQTFDNLAMPQNLGPKWFQKSRYYDNIEAGLKSGLKLKTTNPEQLVTDRLLSGADMRQRMELLNRLQAMGLAVPLKNAPPLIANQSWRTPEPWQQINAPDRQAWMIAPDVQPLWKNAVEAKGLWSNPNAVGSAFRGWMALKNAWVPIKLGLSLFHPVHVWGINLANNLSRALNETFGKGQQSIIARARAIPEATAQSLFDTLLAAPVGTPFTGKAGRAAWLTPRDKMTPDQRARVDLYNEGGFSPQLSEQFKIAGKRAVSDALDRNQYLKAAGLSVGRLIKGIQKPIFEEWIPNLKAAAFDRRAASLFRQRPDLLNDPVNRAVALRAIGKEIDNRFGEMFYGSLFWDRTVKDAAIGSFLSLGWNLGFVREFAGGVLEPAARRLASAPTPTRQLIRDVTTKSTNTFMYALTSMIGAGIINYSLTGDMPEGWDYIFPRIGGNNPDGSPRRVTTPFYTREVPMAQKNIQDRESVIGGLGQMLSHKMMASPATEWWSNKDYMGYQLYDPNAPGWKQAFQYGSGILNEQLNPMSIVGAKRALSLSGKPDSPADILRGALTGDKDIWLSLLGFGPAPAYASRSAIQNRIASRYYEHVVPSGRPYEQKENYEKRRDAYNKYNIAQQTGNMQMLMEARKELIEAGVKPSGISKIKPGTADINMFSRLPEPDQLSILKDSNRDEFKRYYLKSKQKIKQDPDISALYRYYYNLQ